MGLSTGLLFGSHGQQPIHCLIDHMTVVIVLVHIDFPGIRKILQENGVTSWE